MLAWIISGTAAYLLGAIPFGYLVARARGVDIRKAGSGNIGATNVFRCVGKSWGILTFCADAAKGFVAAFVFPLLASRISGTHMPSAPVLCACLAVAGHNWPVYLRFRGGKGIATSAGALAGVAPAAVGIGAAAWIIVFLTTRYVSVASISAAVSIPVSAWLLYRGGSLVLPSALSLLGVVAVWRHRSNLRRLLQGTEHRVRLREHAAQRTGERTRGTETG
jgi:glycerol-3-phosphate acyltransferase PlsY